MFLGYNTRCERTALSLRILEVSDSITGPESECSQWGCSGFRYYSQDHIAITPQIRARCFPSQPFRIHSWLFKHQMLLKTYRPIYFRSHYMHQ